MLRSLTMRHVVRPARIHEIGHVLIDPIAKRVHEILLKVLKAIVRGALLWWCTERWEHLARNVEVASGQFEDAEIKREVVAGRS